MPPMHSTPRPKSASSCLAADQTLHLSFPPKTPGGTQHGGMDDWLDGIDLSAEIELEEEVLTGFGERTGNLFGVDDNQGLVWRGNQERMGVSRKVQGGPVQQPPAKQLPTPSPEPGSLPLPATTTSISASFSALTSGESSSCVVRPPSGSSRPTHGENAVGAPCPRRRDRPAPSSVATEVQPVASGSKTRSAPTPTIRPQSPARQRRKRSRSPTAADEARLANLAEQEGALPVASSSRVLPSRSIRSRSPQADLVSRPHKSGNESASSGNADLARPSPSSAILPPPAPGIAAARPRPSIPPSVCNPKPSSANPSIRSLSSSTSSSSFSFSFSRDQPPKDDFFARRMRDSYIGPVGITGLAASSSPPVDTKEDSETLEQGIHRLREEIPTCPQLSGSLAADRLAASSRSSSVDDRPLTPAKPLSAEPDKPPSQSAMKRRQSTSETVMAFFSKYLARGVEAKISVATDPPPEPTYTTAEAGPSTNKRAQPRSPSPHPPASKRSRETTATSTASSATSPSSRAPLGEKRRGDGNGRMLSNTVGRARAADSKGKGRAVRPDPGKRPLPPPARPLAEPFEKRITKPQPFVFQPLAPRPNPPPSSRRLPPISATGSKPAGFVPSFKDSHNALEQHARARAAALAAQRAKLIAEREASSKALFSGLEERMAKRGKWEEEVRRKEAEKEQRRREDEQRAREKEAREIREERRRTIIRARPVPDMYRRPELAGPAPGGSRPDV